MKDKNTGSKVRFSNHTAQHHKLLDPPDYIERKIRSVAIGVISLVVAGLVVKWSVSPANGRLAVPGSETISNAQNVTNLVAAAAAAVGPKLARVTGTSSAKIVRSPVVVQSKVPNKPVDGAAQPTAVSNTPSKSNTPIRTEWRIRSDSLGQASSNQAYPSHPGILATYFEAGAPAGPGDAGITNQASAWIGNWYGAMGGADMYQSLADRNPQNLYQPRSFNLKRNPFYFALPADPEEPEAAAYFGYWKDGAHHPLGQFAERWIEVTRYEGGTGYRCYAQWEDVGPGAVQADFKQYNYVFGTGPVVNSYNGVGLDVSPACAIALGITPELGVSNVTWKFVNSPPAGPWLDRVN